MNYTYLLRCADGTLYCGWTNHLEKRVEAHNAGKGAKYTKSRRPVILVYYEEYETKSEALRREAAIKKLSRQEKLRMIKQFEVIYALSDFLIMILSWLVKQSLRAFLFQEVQP